MCVHSKQSTMNYYFPEEVLEHVFDYLPSYADRNTVSLVCKFWYDVERFSRKKVFVVNCYAISPERVIARFPRLTSLALNGKPDAFVFTLIPPDWGGFVKPWIEMMVSNGVNLEELNLKRMVVSDESLELLSRSFPNFKSLVMFRCQSFSSDGLASIASNCRSLRVLDLQENDVDDIKGHWLSCFPNSCMTLVSLNFSCLKGEVNSEALERLVARCPNLVRLRLNYSVPLDILQRILVQAPQLVDLGVGSFVSDPVSETYNKLMNTLQRCTSITSLSGFLSGVSVSCLPAFYPICQGLTSLDFSHSSIQGSTVWQLICHCRKLECLWVQATIGDLGLAIVASTCKELHELRIFRNDRHMMMQHVGVTEEGLIVLSAGCPKLKTLLYMCERMTNVALMTLAKNCPGLVTFILQSQNPEMVDVATMQTFDEGFGVIVQSCKGLKRLGLSGVLTDQVFLYIGMYAEQLEMLSIPFVGENSDSGMLYVLNGCKKLKELNIMNSPFGDVELLADVSKYETIRCLCMLSCQVTLGACKELAQQMPRLNVEIVGPNEMLGLDMEIPSPDDRDPIKKIYVYRTLAGPRKDAPGYVHIL